MKEFFKTVRISLSFLFCFSFLQTMGSTHLISSSKIGSLGSLEIKLILLYAGIPFDGVPVYGVDAYKISYSTTDVHGNPAIASGALYIPRTGSCMYLPLLSWQHSTEFDKNEVASNNKGNYMAGYMFSSFGYMVSMPDYLGLGDNQGIHPFHHGISEATAALDLIKAAREFLQGFSHVADNNQLFITGYSQGGHATMALHHYIQNNNLYGEFNVIASAPMSGAYDLTRAQFDLIFDGDSIYPVNAFFPYMLASYQHVYGNLYDSYQQIYDPPYDAEIERMLTGNHTWGEWNAALPQNYYQFMQDSVIANMLADETRRSHPILKAMYENSYTSWVPERPLKMLYAGNDNIVTPENALHTLAQMNALGASKVDAVNADPDGDHESGFIPLMIYTLKWFQTLKMSCQLVTGNNEVRSGEEFIFYPNPTTGTIHISSDKIAVIEIYSITGHKIMERKVNGRSISLEGLNPGCYLIRCIDKSGTFYKAEKLIVQP